MQDLEIKTSSIEAILALPDDEVMFMLDQLSEFIKHRQLFEFIEDITEDDSK